ncbi:pyridoxamine 5'-phosphate oxidase family protein [Fulvivirga lutimaris]|uniref:pyridoxamine 5'-phosphate oxidase family protein n=1 Tax=Fulvivirga lutimaris TaxID=1819566 RepID=UPI0012BCAB80|nr:pyridoxamine 5'-phosphate oxidase family protein [Fulvivirga lutimaris]MTI39750.1 pyridoxamine 5'-phosphate oxidase family protein [Fulvivirga lutimaris]
MSKKLESITPELKSFIEQQKIFFVGTAMAEGTVNVSPKGMDSLRVINENRVMWLNLTGSGNETATHLQNENRITIMFCAFEGKPLILRLYGKAKVYHERDEAFEKYIDLFSTSAGARQIIEVDVELVQTSCGFAVPLMDFKEERTILKDWADKKGEEGIRDYWKEKNTVSLDGHETKIFDN